MIRLEIKDYRILRHRFSITTFTGFAANEVVFDEDVYKNIEFIYLIFNYNGLFHKVVFPPSDEYTVAMLVSKCIEHNRCSIGYPSGHMRIEPRQNMQESSQKKNELVRSQINKELMLCSEKYNLTKLMFVHTLICHYVSFLDSHEEYEQIVNKHHIYLKWEDEDGYPNEVFEVQHSLHRGYADIIDSIMPSDNIEEIDASVLSFRQLQGLVLFEADVLKLFFEPLVDCLNGYNICIDSVFIRKEDFGTKIFDSKVNITDNPFMNCQSVIDDEGSALISKRLIDGGVLVQCLNDLVSASLLNQCAGNAVYSESKNSIEIECSFWDVTINPIVHDCTPDIRIIGVENDFVYLDVETGNMSCTVIGLDVKRNTYHRFHLVENFVTFINRIHCSTGNTVVIGRMRLPDTILNFN